ncbi:hypothetical protein D2T31_03625 [Sinirhodobacter populi]|uniref:C-type lysozyme inhibitor domain-containing protein n=1 Tax=Paenirhodobacter populi TaxID=2306993 RepID=A0A443KH24_9RHOB|nr:hypothetical protein [Sinirhodobacter populi]RWR32054.1 hypothetical protein D2T31_03625 [Sinirhodobacter populi]
MKALAFAAMVCAAASAALADSDHRKGTEGLSPLDYAVENIGATVLSCDVKLAHWYSDHLATIAPQAQGGFTLWSDAATGAVYLMNEAQDRMPVERLWCGLDGRSWETRHEIDLARRGGAVATAPILRCAAQETATDCR